MEISNSSTSYNEYNQTNSIDNTSNKKTNSTDNTPNIEFFESLFEHQNILQEMYGSKIKNTKDVDNSDPIPKLTLEDIIENHKQSLQQHKEEKEEKMSNKDLLDGVTYDPYTDKYTLVIDDYGVKKREFQHKVIVNNSTIITSDKPITREYLQERYEKIQYFFRNEYTEFNKQVTADNSILVDIGIGMGGFSQRDAYGIVKIDGEYIEIDGDEFRKHRTIHNLQLSLDKNPGMSIKEDPLTSVYYKELNGIEPSFENAEEFEYYIKKDEWQGDHILTMCRKISLAVNLGLIEEGNQTLFPQLYQTHKASYTFKNIENDILSQAVLDSIEKYSSVMEGIMYDVLFGTDDKFFQNNLNEFAKELKNNPSKYPSVNSNFTFTGDINLDENSTDEYKDFITNTLIDFVEKQKNDYINGNHPIKDPYRKDSSVAYSFDTVINNLKDSISKNQNIEENNMVLNEYVKKSKNSETVARF